MQLNGDHLNLSATDLAKHLGCRHSTALDLAAAHGEIQRPAWYNPLVVILQKRGLEHEAAYLDDLAKKGIELGERQEGLTFQQALDWTVDAMKAGAPAIVQAALESAPWSGYADVLLRIDTPSALGVWSYEVVDTKLSRETRGATLLQLALYSEMVGEIQRRPPGQMHVVKPLTRYEPESFRTGNYAAYHRFIKRRMEASISTKQETASVAGSR